MSIVRESILRTKKIEVSSGLVIICKNRILLVHSTNSPWKNSYGIPKGHVKDGESLLDAAIRETKEEVGLTVSKDCITDERGTIEYVDKRGRTYKLVHYFVARLDNEPAIHKSNLQKSEVDHAKFFDLNEANEAMLWRFKSLLKLIK